jgi:hypothetical protein
LSYCYNYCINHNVRAKLPDKSAPTGPFPDQGRSAQACFTLGDSPVVNKMTSIFPARSWSCSPERSLIQEIGETDTAFSEESAKDSSFMR